MIELVVIGWGVVSALELLFWLPLFWRFHKAISIVMAFGISIVSGALIGLQPSFWALLIVVVSFYRIINLLRLVENRTRADYLRFVARRSSLLLILSQFLIFGIVFLQLKLDLSFTVWIFLLLGLQLLAAALLLSSTMRHSRTTKAPNVENDFADRDLPTLTVAIPARNETTDLEDCLQSLLVCNYPKLEVLVLDDCSQLKRTPEIIREFAHDGVRFIAGKASPSNWLAKNHAYQQLVEASNGEILLFCGVDARFSEQSLKTLVATMLKREKDMLSIIPTNKIYISNNFWLLSVQPSRYAWELALPRRWLQRPPVLSTCWLITRKKLDATGGFAAVKRSISPESFLAREIARRFDGYSFLQSNATIGISSTKSLQEQNATSVRTRYPQMHRRPELVALFSLLEALVFIGPMAIFVISMLNSLWILGGISATILVLLTVFYALIVRITYRQSLLRGFVLLPIAAIYDIWLLNYSMWQYEFSDVIWKDRNVCIPVMRVIPSLPKI